ncbi:hypothetical protein SXANM310S_00122 [Streptomyces xanthochromogenes]
MIQRPGDHLRQTRPAWERLEDKILVHTKVSVPGGMGTVLAADAHDGVVLCGAAALPTAGILHRRTQGGRLQLVDPDTYGGNATTEQPYQLGRDRGPGQESLFGQDSLFGEDELSLLRTTLNAQLHRGTVAGLTPTRYIAGGDRDAVSAVVEGARDLDPDRNILTLPLDYKWLRVPDDLDHLITALTGLPHVKAVALGAAMNPLTTRGAVAALRHLIKSVDRIALIRTDLAGLDAYAHGALFVSIGMQTSMRHVSPPGSVPPRLPEGRNVTTVVLHPQLMDYFKADRLREHYGRLPSPLCHCAVCHGRSLLRFEHCASDREEANRHNIATWWPWADELQRTAPGAARRNAWQQLCRDALVAVQDLREELANPGALETPRWLTAWAGESA